MMINNKMETKTVGKLRKIAKKSRMSTKCQQNLQLYKGNYPLFTNLLFAFFCFFVFLLFAFGIGFYSLKSLRCVFFYKKIAQTLKIKAITFHMPGNFSFLKNSTCVRRNEIGAARILLV